MSSYHGVVILQRDCHRSRRADGPMLSSDLPSTTSSFLNTAHVEIVTAPSRTQNTANNIPSQIQRDDDKNCTDLSTRSRLPLHMLQVCSFTGRWTCLLLCALGYAVTGSSKDFSYLN
jgi:hypothetical protein